MFTGRMLGVIVAGVLVLLGCGGGGSGGSSDGAGDVMYFSAKADTTTGYQLWKTDGTADGTVLVKTLNAAFCTNGFIPFRGATYFFAYTGGKGRLWKTDGSSDGTATVTETVFSTNYCEMLNAVVFNGALYFTGYDAANKRQLWTTDGTAEGTHEVTSGSDIAPLNLTVFDGALYFVGHDAVNGYQLWKSDGTASGTGAVTALTGVTPAYLSARNGALYFSDMSSTEVWRSDGTAAGTVKLLEARGSGGSLERFVEFGGLVYFSMYFLADGTWQHELWKSDGTAAGTVLVASGEFSGLTVFKNALYFTRGGQLWTTDGAADALVTSGVLLYAYGVFNHSLYLTGDDEVHGRELWTSDGTPDHTRMVRDLCPGPCAAF